jgi:excisionase family DNA binding protein
MTIYTFGILTRWFIFRFWESQRAGNYTNSLMVSGLGRGNLNRKTPGTESENCVFLVELSSSRYERLYLMTGDTEGGMETYLTIAELAGLVKLSEQTIRRYVLNRTIPYRKIYKAVRFRLSEIETWIDGGGISADLAGPDVQAGELFAEAEGEAAMVTEPGEDTSGNPQGLQGTEQPSA